MRSAFVIVLCLGVTAGCGGGGRSGYADAANAACRDFTAVAFDGQVSVDRARVLYANLARRLSAAGPGDDVLAAHRIVEGFARDGEKAFTMSRAQARRAPTVDLRLSVGPGPAEIRVVRDAGLGRCGDLLDGRTGDPETEVIR